jgi:hypothetical protein
MATIIGRNAKVAISTDDTTYYDLGKVTSGGLSIDVDLADETNNDSGGWKESKVADKQATVDVGGKFNSADNGQKAAMASIIAGSNIYLRFRPAEGAGETQWKGLFQLSNWGVDTATGDVEDFSVSTQSTETVAQSTQ